MRPSKSNWRILKLTSPRSTSHLKTATPTCWKEKTTRFSRLLTEFSEDQKEKVLDNFKLLDQSKSGQSLSCGTSVGHELSINPLMLEKNWPTSNLRSLEPTTGALLSCSAVFLGHKL